MASATVSTEFEETYSLNYQALIGQSIILIIISSIVDGSPLLLLNSAMVLGTCVLLKEIIQNTILVPPGQGQNPHVLPLADVGQGVVQEGETAAALPIATSSKSKHSRQNKPTRDYEPMRFSKSLGVRGSRYFYDTREVESSDEAPEPLSKKYATDEKAKELKESWGKDLRESLDEVMKSSTQLLPPSPSRVKDLASEARATPSRAASTMLAGFFTFIFIFIFSALLVDTLDADEEVWWYDARLF